MLARDRAGRTLALDQHRQALLSAMLGPGRLSADGRGAILGGDAAWLRNSSKRCTEMRALTLDQASIIVDKALEKGRELKLQPLTVVVLDAGGQLKAMKREDRSSLLRPEIAGGKAWGVLGMGFGGREFARRAAANPVFLQALMAASGGRIVPVPGGVLIRDDAGDIIGSVGISGDTSDKDEACAVHGISSAGLSPDTGDPG
jgi:uncharacterized protein GlcG (DUF336 family)